MQDTLGFYESGELVHQGLLTSSFRPVGRRPSKQFLHLFAPEFEECPYPRGITDGFRPFEEVEIPITVHGWADLQPWRQRCTKSSVKVGGTPGQQGAPQEVDIGRPNGCDR